MLILVAIFVTDLAITIFVASVSPTDVKFLVMLGGIFIAVICNVWFAHFFRSAGLKRF